MSQMPAVGKRSQAEIADAIQSLSDADLARLRAAANRYAHHSMPAEDLIQEAYTRALDGSRACPRHVGVVKFLAEAMRSIANGEHEKAKLHPSHLPIDVEDGGAEAVNCPDPSLGAEGQLIQTQQVAHVRSNILALFEDNSVARDVVEGTMEEMTAEELRQLTGLDEKAYNSMRRLIRRRIDKHFPGGWPS